MKKLFWPATSLLWAALILNLTTTPNLVVAPENWLNMLLMNGAHFAFFGVQAALISKFSKAGYAVIITSLYGYYIEYLQRTIPGRSYDLMDWALDTLGAIIFVLVLQRLRGKKII